MIKQIRVQNYKALRDVTLDLTPIHVLIGPNDSGKTSILEAIAALCRSVDAENLVNAFLGPWEGQELTWQSTGDVVVFEASFATRDAADCKYKLACEFAATQKRVRLQDESNGPITPSSNSSRVSYLAHRLARSPNNHDKSELEYTQKIHDLLSGVHLYRWEPASLAQSAPLETEMRFMMERSGYGLARCLDDILGYDRSLFDELEQHLCAIFPEIRSVKIQSEKVATEHGKVGKALWFELRFCKNLVPARQASDGVLLVLAYLALLYQPKPPRVLLIEEPENGIHPQRLKEVLLILRKLIEQQQRTQILLTTHSPYVLDHFEPHEVTVCRKQADGSVATSRLSESKIVLQQKELFTLGEIWTGEGDDALGPTHSPEATS